jgi:hypothetical protein
VTAEHWICYQ